MLSSARKAYSLSRNLFYQEAHCGYATKKVVRFTGQAKQFVNDGTGKHIPVVKEECVFADCKNKKCSSLCDTEKVSVIKGHNTHKPIMGRFTKFISESDANEEQKVQYFVKTNKKSERTPQEKQQYSKDIKLDSKQQNFIVNYSNKYDE